jgi:leucyl aminopeptidase
VLVGLGDADAIDLDGLRAAAAAGAQASIGCNGSLGLQLPWDSQDSDQAARISAEAVRLSLYADQRFQKEPEERRLPTALELIGLPASAAAGLEPVNATCAGVELARELVAAPPNYVTPAALADTAAALARDYGMELTILERA